MMSKNSYSKQASIPLESEHRQRAYACATLALRSTKISSNSILLFTTLISKESSWTVVKLCTFISYTDSTSDVQPPIKTLTLFSGHSFAVMTSSTNWQSSTSTTTFCSDRSEYRLCHFPSAKIGFSLEGMESNVSASMIELVFSRRCICG